MIFDSLFSDLDHCLDNIENGKQELSDVLFQVNIFIERFVELRNDIKALRKHVVDNWLQYDEQKSYIASLFDELHELSVHTIDLGKTIAAKSDLLGRNDSSQLERFIKFHAVESHTLYSRINDTVCELRTYQRNYNIGLIKLHDAQEVASKLLSDLCNIEHNLDKTREKLEKQTLSHNAVLVDLDIETQKKYTEVNLVKSSVTISCEDLRSCEEELIILKNEKEKIELLFTKHQITLQTLIEESNSLSSTIASCRATFLQLTDDFSEAKQSNIKQQQNIIDLKGEKSKAIDYCESLACKVNDLSGCLNSYEKKKTTLEDSIKTAESKKNDYSNDITTMSSINENLTEETTSLLNMEKQWLSTFENIQNMVEKIEQLESSCNELDIEFSSIDADVKRWKEQNNILEVNRRNAKKAEKELEASRLSLEEAVDKDKAESQKISDTLDELNKSITQSRIVLEDLKTQFDTAQGERDSRLSGLKHRHMDEYKEKQSVKICDIKASLKQQRETILEGKREELEEALKQYAAKLDQETVDLERSRRAKLDGDARLIKQLQGELNKLRNGMCH
ncbi:chromosome segregation ATPase family protein [Babesia bovis T2Bo]|uniref:chromosome segregation ATPase family protein n=1 Tax=Babesia bovis T2Bo TaxID=484906 RepID=UPI001C36D539|nr:chromosome segregation ATPase family protein [Babesia bovis T2Bo]KAG6440056.1 chromosome segregation ATPase family protein [Babesia bovis T2Bo]